MAYVRSNCSGCGSCCNNGYARTSCGWNNWGWGNWNRSCNNCGCNSCNGCNSCSSCNNCSSCNSCNNCGSCSTCNSSRCGCGCSSGCEPWNCGRSGCGNSLCSSGYGLLRSVAGPYNCIVNGLRFPFYTGPCGPCADDCCNKCCGHGCNSCCNDCCDDCCETCCCEDGACTSATFTSSTPVELAAGDSVELECTAEHLNDFTVTQDGIRIHRAGSYMVIYTVHVPANETVSSRFILALNGDRIAASAADVCSVADGTTNGYSMHALVRADSGDLLKLVSLSPVSICQSSASNVFTLSLTRID